MNFERKFKYWFWRENSKSILYSQIELGPKNRLSQSIPAYGYWNVQFYQMEAAYVHFDLWLPRGASLGFYARRNALPTHTNYDLMEVIKGSATKDRNTRSIQVCILSISI